MLPRMAGIRFGNFGAAPGTVGDARSRADARLARTTRPGRPQRLHMAAPPLTPHHRHVHACSARPWEPPEGWSRLSLEPGSRSPEPEDWEPGTWSLLRARLLLRACSLLSSVPPSACRHCAHTTRRPRRRCSPGALPPWWLPGGPLVAPSGSRRLPAAFYRAPAMRGRSHGSWHPANDLVQTGPRMGRRGTSWELRCTESPRPAADPGAKEPQRGADGRRVLLPTAAALVSMSKSPLVRRAPTAGSPHPVT